jgi:modulator of FtsH protease HflK
MSDPTQPTPNPSASPGAHPAPSAPAPAPTPVEDAGSRALSEALRSSFVIVKIVMIGFVLAFFFSGVFVVQPNQEAVVLRLGRPVGFGAQRLLKPGLHWALPYPIDEIVRIPVLESHSVSSSIGWWPVTPQQEVEGAEPQGHGSLTPLVDGYTLTGDGDIINVRATLKYRISDPISYAFNFAGITNLLQNCLNNAILYASARFGADGAISEEKIAFHDLVQERVEKLVTDYRLGITLEPIYVQTAAPPDVRQAFDNVVSAEQDRSKSINDAEGDARQTLLTAQSEATVILNDALSATNQLLQTAAADAKQFSALLPVYQQNEGLFKRQLLIQTIANVMTNADEKWYIPTSADGKPSVLWLMLNREPVVPSANGTAQP